MKTARTALCLVPLLCSYLCYAQENENVKAPSAQCVQTSTRSADRENGRNEFERSRDRWVETNALTPGGGGIFGIPEIKLAMDKDGDTLAMGERTVDIDGSVKEGAVFIFRKHEGTFNRVAELTASDGVAIGGFGDSVGMSCDGKTIAVGAENSADANLDQGSAYIFVEPEEGWRNMTETAKLTASDGQSGDGFGNAVAVGCQSGTVFIGALFAPADLTNSLLGPGAVYVFHRPRHGWETTSHFSAKLTASDGLALDGFGAFLSVSSDAATLLVSAPDAPFDSLTSIPGPGAAYLFVRPDGGWTTTTETAKLTGSDTAGIQYGFGTSIALDGDGKIALVGAPNPPPGSGLGAIFVFVKPVGGWVSSTGSTKLTASDGEPNDGFGNSVAIAGDDDEVFVGALGYPFNLATQTRGSGAVYVYDRPRDGWTSSSEFQQKLIPTEVDVVDFGTNIALGKQTLAVGSPMSPASTAAKVDIFEKRHDEH